MKRFLTILLAAVMMLSAVAAMTVGVAATTTGGQEIYLSDITPTSWKMLDGCTPGYNVYYEDDSALVLAGVTYDKGLSTHPGAGFDAEFVYDISGYDYTTFSAIVGKTDRYVAALPGSFTSFYVYVDGVLADEVINLVAGQTYSFQVDVTGASQLKLVTAGGSDNITCDGSVWANAKLSNDPIVPADPEGPSEDAGKEVFLSDITPKSATALSGPFYDRNEQGEPLLLGGITYKKGIWTHPMSNKEAQAVYDISGYDYTVFSAVVGKEQKYAAALPNSLLTFRVYVDGVLADEVVDMPAGDTYTFEINITGASELKLVTGAGSDDITCDGSIWGDAKLRYETPAEPENPPVDTSKALYLSDATPKKATAFSGPFYDQNEQGEALTLDGITYEKGIWTHPMSNKDAEIVYDIKGYGYTVFYAVVGKEQKYVTALPGSLLTFRVYVDGVLADEVVDLVAGNTYTFKVDITGASELKLVTGAGSDDITCDASVWADAKLTWNEDHCQEHSWGEGVVVKESTCTDAGQMKYQCANCIGVKTEEIPLLSHIPGSWTVGASATCTEAGTKVKKCLECGEVVDTTVWEAKGHTPGTWATTENATCTEAGKKAQNCLGCGAVLNEEEIPALGHSFGEWVTEGKKQVRVCECGEKETQGGCAALLSVGSVTIMLLAAFTVAFLLTKKKDKVNQHSK